MLFSSITFLYYFLPAVLLVYFLVPKCLKNATLLLFSLLFYSWGEPKYVFLMAGTVIVCYGLGILTEKFRGRLLSRLSLVAALVLCLGLLGYFKYTNFFIDTVNSVTGLSVPLLNIVLPIGISFYTFQILSYVIDVYRGRVSAQKNIITLGTYISMFPQLIAGPIVRYSDVEKQLKSRTHTFEKVSSGIKRFVTGLSKKVLVANVLGELGEAFYAVDEKSVLFYWLFVISYALQVYFDFSGYSDMAIGLGRILGFNFPENFNYPFISKSISEFWRRWHMTLGSWFRDYVYIPMGGNRVGKIKLGVNLLTVWLLTGLWHGAQWNFVLWGLFFALILSVEKLFLPKIQNKKVWSRIYTLFFIIISFAIFAAPSLKGVGEYLKGMWGMGGIPFVNGELLYNLRSYAVTLIIAVIASTPILLKVWNRLKGCKGMDVALNTAEILFVPILMVVCTAYLADGAFNPFLYFRF